MATRYLCIIGPGASARTGALASTPAARYLQTALSDKNLVVQTDTPEVCLCLPGGNGVIIGPLFSRADVPIRIKAIDSPTADRIARSDGQMLIDDFWGGYVALTKIRGSNTLAILRDPSGAMPAYFLSQGDDIIIASDIETLLDARLLVPQIDWTFIANFLQAFDLRTPRTGLVGLSEVPAGYRLIVDAPIDDTRLSPCWSPWDFTAPRHRSREEVVAQVRSTVHGCVTAWGQQYSHVLLGVSGGLDSSIIAACLKDQTDLLTLTMATDEGEGDERAWARLLTQALKLPMIEGIHTLATVDVRRSTSLHLPRPLSGAYSQFENGLKFELARTRGIDAFFAGVGGDNVFCLIKSASPIIDRWMIEGPGPGVVKTLRDMCQLTGASFWEAIGKALKRARAPSMAYEWRRDYQFLSDTARALALPIVHPWLTAPEGTPPGKAAHVAMLLRIQGTIDGFPRIRPPLVNPLLSQPIVEACLGIQTWEWCHGGQNRSVAREAFSGLLPPAIVTRTSKGGPNSFAYDVIDRQKREVRDLLLNGLLAQRGFLDLDAIDRALDLNRPVSGTDHMRLSALAETEAWVRHWHCYQASVHAPTLSPGVAPPEIRQTEPMSAHLTMPE